ncbi:MAG: flagellar basal body-associated FliL family protein [Bdellovibrio sp.]|nr:flagellar basal body-associated FliL family protein [Bdellovibrio sp.]
MFVNLKRASYSYKCMLMMTPTPIEPWSLRQLFVRVFKGIFARDLSFKLISFLFLGSLFGIGLVGVFSYELYQKRIKHQKQLSQAELTAKHLGDFFEKQIFHAKRRYTLVELGDFTLELKPLANQKTIKGVLNMAEIELVAECDTKETCSFVETHLLHIRDQLTNVFLAIDREELISKDGKKRIYQTIIDRLNGWLPKGKIQNIYVMKLIVS